MKARKIYPHILFFLGLALIASIAGCSVASTPTAQILSPVPNMISQSPSEVTSSPIASPTALETALPHETALPYDQLVALFDYDHSTLPSVKENRVQSNNGAQVHDINFTDSYGTLRKAFLVTPSGEGPFAAIEFLGWGTRDQFLSEAISFARLGVVSLLLPDSFNPTRSSAETDRQQLIQLIVDLRQGLDLLLSQPGVVSTRLAFVGLSDGANFGAILAGVDKRPIAYVLISGDGHKSKELEGHLIITDPTEQAAYLKTISQLDGINFISHVAPAALLFQNGTQDEIVPVPEALKFQQAGSEPKTIKMYDAGHTLNEQARKDRIAWLEEQLQLSSQ